MVRVIFSAAALAAGRRRCVPCDEGQRGRIVTGPGSPAPAVSNGYCRAKSTMNFGQRSLGDRRERAMGREARSGQLLAPGNGGAACSGLAQNARAHAVGAPGRRRARSAECLGHRGHGHRDHKWPAAGGRGCCATLAGRVSALRPGQRACVQGKVSVRSRVPLRVGRGLGVLIAAYREQLIPLAHHCACRASSRLVVLACELRHLLCSVHRVPPRELGRLRLETHQLRARIEEHLLVPVARRAHLHLVFLLRDMLESSHELEKLQETQYAQHDIPRVSTGLSADLASRTVRWVGRHTTLAWARERAGLSAPGAGEGQLARATARASTDVVAGLSCGRAGAEGSEQSQVKSVGNTLCIVLLRHSGLEHGLLTFLRRMQRERDWRQQDTDMVAAGRKAWIDPIFVSVIHDIECAFSLSKRRRV
ncbi:hypothetical protein GGX14DRAFT_388967 [Mycena pura]|uniref:Uncharacterized protein n=1 Tax=Mycena pura TaxID=153505 RepID=A0AAD6VRA0_9AGAR|nr:hypothetical protein GGX14DRAFT_388967 [Mycena pura]